MRKSLSSTWGKNRKHHVDEGTGHDEPNRRFTKNRKRSYVNYGNTNGRLRLVAP